GHSVRVLRQIVESNAPTRLHTGLALDGPLQHRLDFHLGDPHRWLPRHAPVIRLADNASPFGHARVAEAMEFVARERCDPGDVEIVALRHRYRSELVHQPKPAKQLHAANICDVHLRVARGGGIAFHQHAGDAPPRQIACRRHADGATASNEDRNLVHARLPYTAAARAACLELPKPPLAKPRILNHVLRSTPFDVAYWHNSDVPRCPRNVPYRGHSGSEMLTGERFAFGPTSTLAVRLRTWGVVGGRPSA